MNGKLDNESMIYYEFISVSLNYMKGSKEVISVVYYQNKNVGGQSFPIVSKKPKDLGKLAQNIFKWNKSIIDKL